MSAPRPLAIVQARMGSERLAGKVLAELAGKTVLDYVIARCRLAKKLGDVVIATTESPGDEPIVDYARTRGLGVFRGSEADVLERYHGAARHFGAQTIVRVTADSPVVDPAIIDEIIAIHERTGADYVCFDEYSLGLASAELITMDAIERSHEASRGGERRYREHVTQYVIAHPDKFAVRIELAPPAFRRPDLRVTVDEPDDLRVVRKVCEHFAPRLDFSSAEIIAYLDAHPDLAAWNRHVQQKSA